ncbi:MAG: aminomethyl transferase family protein [Candidatus Cloacimonetes bacterium]|nr:aminomethyl transferase family protein [Candidatus Cloacimonadota bacterium]NLO12359.1 aminomethyl transferase family protein [Candidatus Cloacimonadota bacterium]
MEKFGFEYPHQPRKTFLYELEENWYLPLLAEHKGIPLATIKRSNFGHYDMAVNYLTSVLDEAAAVNKVAIYNIDHMAQIRFWGRDAGAVLDRALAGNISQMKVGACKYTLLLNDSGGVEDDMIMMRASDTEFIMVINAGHDITATVEINGVQQELIADIDRVMRQKRDDEEIWAEDISNDLVKVDIQGPLSFKLIKEVFGADVLKNRNNPDKNMSFFTFNEVELDGHKYYFSRTGYTNRWGWECYLPAAKAAEDFKKIVSLALEWGGLLVGLGGRDENRISAGAVGLPLMGSEYDPQHTPINAPLFEAAVDMEKPWFVGKEALQKELAAGTQKGLVICISEGIASQRGVYLDGKRLGSITSSINSPNLTHAKRLALGSTRKNVVDPQGTAAIGLAWLYNIPAMNMGLAEGDAVGAHLMVDLYREDATGQPTGSPLKAYLSTAGVSPATSHKALKNIENL